MNGNPLTILNGRATIHIGDVMERLAELPDAFFDAVITSPPYWAVRDYDVEGQIGLEPDLAEHIEKLIAVFESVKRVLKPAGLVFINYGDCYASSPNGRSAAATRASGKDDRTFRDKPLSTVGTGPLGAEFMDRPFRDVVNAAKAKDLCMVPNILALALRAAGWWIRAENIWGKGNPMPDSGGRQRPSVAHEKVWMLAKARTYNYAAGDVSQPASNSGMPNRYLRNFEPAPLSVWQFNAVPFPEAHFATFPPELVERCIAAACPPGGLVLDPFGGAGTTALVALRMGRRAHLIELKPEYAAMARRRLERDWMGDEERRYASAREKGAEPPGPLFETPYEAAE